MKGHTRFWVLTAALVGVVFAVLAGVALLAWPQARLGSADDALARVVLPGVAGRFAERLMIADAHRFGGGPGSGVRRRANLFVTATKPKVGCSPGCDDPG